MDVQIYIQGMYIINRMKPYLSYQLLVVPLLDLPPNRSFLGALARGFAVPT